LRASKISIATIILFGAGLIAASLLIYQQLTPSTKLFKASKDEAIAASLNRVETEPDRDASLLPYERASAKLMHVSHDGAAFITDEISLGDMWIASAEQKFPEDYHNRYFWTVDVVTFDSYGEENVSSRGYHYLIDVNSGEIITIDSRLP